MPDSVLRGSLAFTLRLKAMQRAEPAGLRLVTAKGVLRRKPWLLSFRRADGWYGGWGEGPDGGNAAVLVLTSVPAEEY